MSEQVKISKTYFNILVEKLKTYTEHYGSVIKCRKCTGYYVSGYVCSCGEDNSVKPKENG